MLRSIIKQKKAQVEFSPIVLISIVIGLLILGPIMMRIIGTVTGTFFTQMNDSAPEAVAEGSGAVDKVYNFFDYLIIIVIMINVIMLFVSAWFINTNPVWIIMYIMFAFIFILFVPNLLDAVDAVWERMEDMEDKDTWGNDSLMLDFTDFIRQNLVMFTLIVIVLTGIITYAKFKITSEAF
jgi:hypothetical protein